MRSFPPSSREVVDPTDMPALALLESRRHETLRSPSALVRDPVDPQSGQRRRRHVGRMRGRTFIGVVTMIGAGLIAPRKYRWALGRDQRHGPVWASMNAFRPDSAILGRSTIWGERRALLYRPSRMARRRRGGAVTIGGGGLKGGRSRFWRDGRTGRCRYRRGCRPCGRYRRCLRIDRDGGDVELGG